MGAAEQMTKDSAALLVKRALGDPLGPLATARCSSGRGSRERRGAGRCLVPVVLPRFTRPARRGQRTTANRRSPPHVGPHGLSAPEPDWLPRSQSEGVVGSGRADWPPQASPGRGRGSLLFFPPPHSSCPHPGVRAARNPVAGMLAASEDPPRWPLGTLAFLAAPSPPTHPQLAHTLEEEATA